MSSKAVETQRIDIRVPINLLKEIEQYQIKNNIPTRTSAMLELVRIGLSTQKQK